jgi:hypothetical protein
MQLKANPQKLKAVFFFIADNSQPIKMRNSDRCFFNDALSTYIVLLFLSQWPRHLSTVWSCTTRTITSRFRIPLEAWAYVHFFLCCAVLCRYRLCDWPIHCLRVLQECLNGLIGSELNSELSPAGGPNTWNVYGVAMNFTEWFHCAI